MSGPITAGFVLIHGTLALAARALAEARAMKGEYQEVLARVRAREHDLVCQREQRQGARLERIAALHRQSAQHEARLQRLRALAEGAGLPGAAPVEKPSADAGDAAMVAYLAALQDAAHAIEAALDRSGAGRAADIRARPGQGDAAPSIEQVLTAYAQQRARTAGLPAAEVERFKATAARVLARLPLAEGAVLPTHLEALARQIVMAPTTERAEALATELRGAVQRAAEAQGTQQRDLVQARTLLGALADDVPPELKTALERVAAGTAPLEPQLRESAQALIDAAADDRTRSEQAAAAYVLEQSLRDLGYEVDDIEATLFADGGTVNFRRAGWDRYFVRLRVAPTERTVNFNVIRARGDEESEARRRLDALAEDRWCAEFPALLRTLEARGLALDVTRRLEAGEVPVQVVDPASVPVIAADEARAAGETKRNQRAR